MSKKETPSQVIDRLAEEPKQPLESFWATARLCGDAKHLVNKWLRGLKPFNPNRDYHAGQGRR